MAVSEWLGSLTHAGDACSNATAAAYEAQAPPNMYVAGVVTSIIADAFIAVALCIQKYAHNQNKGRDGQPIKSYLKLPVWWVGILMNIGGEVGNMLSYGLAPAAVVAPVGSVGVIVNEIIAVLFLKEPLRKRDIFGLCCVIAGVVLVIVTVPEGQETLSVHHLLSSDIYFNPRAYCAHEPLSNRPASRAPAHSRPQLTLLLLRVHCRVPHLSSPLHRLLHRLPRAAVRARAHPGLAAALLVD